MLGPFCFLRAKIFCCFGLRLKLNGTVLARLVVKNAHRKMASMARTLEQNRLKQEKQPTGNGQKKHVFELENKTETKITKNTWWNYKLKINF